MSEALPSPPAPERCADSIPDAAIRLAISESTLRREIRAGNIRAIRARGRVIITRDEQAAWLTRLPTVN